MVRYLLIAIVLLAAHFRVEIRNFIDPPPDYGQAHNVGVVLYATSWCGYCAKAREFLAQNNIPYYEYDIEKSPEGREQHKRLGGSGVPVLWVNGETIKGYQPQLILNAL